MTMDELRRIAELAFDGRHGPDPILQAALRAQAIILGHPDDESAYWATDPIAVSAASAAWSAARTTFVETFSLGFARSLRADGLTDPVLDSAGDAGREEGVAP